MPDVLRLGEGDVARFVIDGDGEIGVAVRQVGINVDVASHKGGRAVDRVADLVEVDRIALADAVERSRRIVAVISVQRIEREEARGDQAALVAFAQDQLERVDLATLVGAAVGAEAAEVELRGNRARGRRCRLDTIATFVRRALVDDQRELGRAVVAGLGAVVLDVDDDRAAGNGEFAVADADRNDDLHVGNRQVVLDAFDRVIDGAENLDGVVDRVRVHGIDRHADDRNAAGRTGQHAADERPFVDRLAVRVIGLGRRAQRHGDDIAVRIRIGNLARRAVAVGHVLVGTVVRIVVRIADHRDMLFADHDTVAAHLRAAVRTDDGDRQGRLVDIAITVFEVIEERVLEFLATGQRLDGRVGRRILLLGVERVGVLAVRVDHEDAVLEVVGARIAEFGIVRTDRVATGSTAVGARAGHDVAVGRGLVLGQAVIVVACDRLVVDDVDGQRRFVGVAIAVDDDDVEEVLRVVAARVVAQRVADLDLAVAAVVERNDRQVAVRARNDLAGLAGDEDAVDVDGVGRVGRIVDDHAIDGLDVGRCIGAFRLDRNVALGKPGFVDERDGVLDQDEPVGRIAGLARFVIRADEDLRLVVDRQRQRLERRGRVVRFGRGQQVAKRLARPEVRNGHGEVAARGLGLAGGRLRFGSDQQRSEVGGGNLDAADHELRHEHRTVGNDVLGPVGHLDHEIGADHHDVAERNFGRKNDDAVGVGFENDRIRTDHDRHAALGGLVVLVLFVVLVVLALTQVAHVFLTHVPPFVLCAGRHATTLLNSAGNPTAP